MNKSYHALPTMRLKTPNVQKPPALPEVIHINDPARSTMIDFSYHAPPTIQAHQSIDIAKTEMQIHQLPLLLVINEEHKFVGVITSEDILGEKPVKISQEKRITRNEIEVEMVMTAGNDIFAIAIEDLQHAKVGHIIQTLRETKQHVLLVTSVDQDTQKQTLIGLFSASIISKQLDKDITTVLSEAQSIAELQHDLHH